MCRYGAHTYRDHFVCLDCRLSVKLDEGRVEPPCPQCGARLVNMGKDFRAPRRANTAQWRKLRLLHAAGIHFFSCGCDGPGDRPDSLRATRSFVTAVRAARDPRPPFARRATAGAP